MDDSLYTVLPFAADSADVALEFSLDTARIIVAAERDTAHSAQTQTVASVEAWRDGLEPQPRPLLPGNRSGFILAIAIVIVVLLSNYRNLRGFIAYYTEGLLRVRRGRDNVFDDQRPATFSPLNVVTALLIVCCGGFLLASGIGSATGADGAVLSGGSVAVAALIVGIYYAVELGAYAAVGYTFSTPVGLREWLRGFVASTSLLSLAIVAPALIALFYPNLAFSMAFVALLLFIIAKLIFIFKGFIIFYDNFYSLLYFILYLCTLEIIPIILVYNSSVRFV